MDDAVLVDAGQGHATGVRTQVGPHLVQGALHAGVDVVGVQVVEHQQRADQLVVGQQAPGVRVEMVSDAVEAGAVQGQHARQQLLDPLGDGRHRTLGQVVEQGADLLAHLTHRR